jgi:hypothetical protein
MEIYLPTHTPHFNLQNDAKIPLHDLTVLVLKPQVPQRFIVVYFNV